MRHSRQTKASGVGSYWFGVLDHPQRGMGLANHGQGWWAREPQDERKRFDANSNATPTAVLFGNGTIASVEWVRGCMEARAPLIIVDHGLDDDSAEVSKRM
ncbi:hypothetical protein CTRI78_v007154 [Colletotrichum trifolii]|uniref:Uncharacterized protein n=1 Tax=Colletotrichum trifolii TaxID=5466 RepID=A0A4R8RE90_COLTR|nr:hypothetical protein CTRI78_v007154 [Colletotrichum trifolii]